MMNQDMNKQSCTMTIFNGTVNKNLRASFGYQFYKNDGVIKYPSIRMTDKGTIVINHSFSLTINQEFGQPGIFIPGKQWNQFCTLLEKTIKLVSESLYDLYPDIGQSEFSIDSRTLDRFKIEKACSTAGISMYPDVWVGEESSCFPAIQINTSVGNCTMMKIPLEDAIPLSSTLNKIDPNMYCLSMLEMIKSMK